MTDNEKAATFIEWQCPVAEGLGYAAAGAPAPDMSKPENYMLALDGATIAWTLQRIDLGEWVCTLSWGKAQKGGKNAGMAVVTALAALYDAEHGS